MRKYKIVIVENDEDEQEFLKEGFDAADLFEIVAQLRSGDDIPKLLEKTKNNLPEIILSDLNMPGKNGYDIINDVKSNPEYSHIPVIITSTSTAPTIYNKCMTMGAADYLVKPDTFIDYEHFVRQLHKRIEEKQLVK